MTFDWQPNAKCVIVAGTCAAIYWNKDAICAHEMLPNKSVPVAVGVAAAAYTADFFLDKQFGCSHGKLFGVIDV